MLYGQEYTDYQAKRSHWRKVLRRFYLRHALKHIAGKTIDFGCGTGELLRLLPSGSVGLEINQASVAYCQDQKLAVALYQPEEDGYKFGFLPVNTYRTFVMVHVLEHLAGAGNIMRCIFASCDRLGIERIVIVVPGMKGFAGDPTHKTFVNKQYIQDNGLAFLSGYYLKREKYFPVNLSWVGKVCKHNEYLIIYEKKQAI